MYETISDAQVERLAAAKRRGYFVGLPADHCDVTNLYFRWCGDQSVPYVFAIRRGRRYFVELDLASYGYNSYEVTQLGREQAERLFQSLSRYRCVCEIGHAIIRIIGVPQELVDPVCRTLVEIGKHLKEDHNAVEAIRRNLSAISARVLQDQSSRFPKSLI